MKPLNASVLTQVVRFYFGFTLFFAIKTSIPSLAGFVLGSPEFNSSFMFWICIYVVFSCDTEWYEGHDKEHCLSAAGRMRAHTDPVRVFTALLTKTIINTPPRWKVFCVNRSYDTKSVMLDGKRIWQPPKQSDSQLLFDWMCHLHCFSSSVADLVQCGRFIQDIQN